VACEVKDCAEEVLPIDLLDVALSLAARLVSWEERLLLPLLNLDLARRLAQCRSASLYYGLVLMMNHDLAMYHSEFLQDLMNRAWIEVREVELIDLLLSMAQVRPFDPDRTV